MLRYMYQGKNKSRKRLFKTDGWVFVVVRLLVGAVGLVFVAAALLKASDMETFIRQIKDYGILSDRNLLVVSAWGLIVSECTLGVALVIFYRPGLILPATAGLLLIFIGGTTWAWVTGSTTDCGCFGSWLKRTPGQGAIEGLIMLAVTILAWLKTRHSQIVKTRGKAWAVAIAGLIGLALPTVSGFTISRIGQSHAKTTEIDFGHLQIQDLDPVNLKQGIYLLILMDTDCSHCQEGVGQLNALAMETGMPIIIALCMNEKSQRRHFEEEFQPLFPLGQIREDVFWRLLADGEIPRTILVRDGHVLKTWDKKIPSKSGLSILPLK